MKNVPILVSPALMHRAAAELRNLTPSSILHRAGKRNVLITSVHGFDHIRDGAVKDRDSGTLEGSHAIALAADASWLAVGQEGLIDSNYHWDTPFKQQLAQYVASHQPALILDIHGAHAFRPFDVEIGSIDQRSWLGQEHWRDALHEMLARHGFLVSDNQVFRAAGATREAQTVTGFCMELGVPCAQLEIASSLLDDLESLQALHAHAKLVNAIAAFIVTLAPRR